MYSYTGGVQWQLLDDYKQDLIDLNKAMEIQQETLPSDSLALARTYEFIASMYDEIKKYDLASECYETTLKMRQVVLPVEHRTIAKTYNNLGAMCAHNGEYVETLKDYEKSLEIKCKTLPPVHPFTAQTEDNIRLTKDKMKK